MLSLYLIWSKQRKIMQQLHWDVDQSKLLRYKECRIAVRCFQGILRFVWESVNGSTYICYAIMCMHHLWLWRHTWLEYSHDVDLKSKHEIDASADLLFLPKTARKLTNLDPERVHPWLPLWIRQWWIYILKMKGTNRNTSITCICQVSCKVKDLRMHLPSAEFKIPSKHKNLIGCVAHSER